MVTMGSDCVNLILLLSPLMLMEIMVICNKFLVMSLCVLVEAVKHLHPTLHYMYSFEDVFV